MHLLFRSMRALLRVFLFGCAAAVCAQSVQRQSWTTEDGLPQNSVHSLLQAPDGTLWLATEGGAARFDGLRFKRFTTENTPAFASNDLCCAVQVQDGSVYFGSSDGIVRLWRGRFERVQGVSGAVESLQAAPNGTLFALTSGGLSAVQAAQGTPVRLPQEAQPTVLAQNGQGAPLAVAGTVLFRWTGKDWLRERDLPLAPVGLVEEGGTLWLRTRSSVVALAGRDTSRWQLGKELPGTRLDSLLHGPEGMIAATDHGSYLLQQGSPFAKPLANVDGETVLSALTDREGDQWFGMDTSGLVVLRKRAIQSLPQLARESVTCVVEVKDGTLWLGTRDSGLRTVTNGVVSTPAVSDKLASRVVLSLAPDESGGVWVGTPEGLDHIADGRLLKHVSDAEGLPDDFVRSLLVEPAGAVWVGTRRGLALWRNDRVERVLTSADGLPSDVVGSMLRSRRGELWIGTLKGLARVAGDARQVQAVRGTAGQAITGITEAENGTVWVSGRNGLLGALLHGEVVPVHLPDLAPPLQAVLADAQGRLWLRTGTGLAQAKASELEACAGREACPVSLRRYGTADGLSSIDVSQDGHPAVWRTRSDVLWFASRRGLSSVDADRLPVDTVPPSVTLQEVLVDGQPVPVGPEVRISAGSRRLQVAYTGLSLLAPAQVRYRFRLEGFDGDWTDAGTRRVAEYTNLPAGTYRLLVEARNADGVLSEAPAEITIKVSPRFYRTWWFYLLVACCVAGVAYALYWLRLRSVRQSFAAVLGERNRIAREIHDTLAQDFVAVSLQLEVATQLLKRDKVEQARQQIDSTRLLVQEGIRDARESIWALRAGGSSQTLPARVQAVVDASKATGVVGQCSVTGSYRVLPPSVEQEILRIAKEAFGNAMKHAKAANIRLELIYSEEAVVLRVSDDGDGFDVQTGSALQGHYGLRGMQERANALGGTLMVQSEPGAGTTVILQLPADRAEQPNRRDDGG